MKRKPIISAIIAFMLLITPALSGCSGETSKTEPINPLIPVASDADTSEPSAQTSTDTPQTSTDTPQTSTDTPQTSTDTPQTSTDTPQTSTDTPQTSTDTPQPSKPAEEIHPAAWKVEDSNGNYIYMMGSIHIGDDSVNYMPDYIMDAYNDSDTLTVELDISSYLNDSSKATEVMQYLMYTDGSTIKEHISEDTYNKAVEYLKSFNMYNEAFDKMRPYMWVSLISSTIQNNTELSIYNGVDYKFLQMAQADNKPVVELETFAGQFDAMNSFSDALNDLMISQMLDENYGTSITDATMLLYECWKNGTLSDELLIDTTFTQQANDDYPLYEEYIEKLITNRNITMAKSAEESINSGSKTFFMVGFLHFCGDQGIISLLEKDGYTVTRL